MKLTGQQCECTACKQLFGRTSTFDAHRQGKVGERRCLSVMEMEEKGWRRNPKEFWKRAPRPINYEEMRNATSA
jgi:hypothetical protein